MHTLLVRKKQSNMNRAFIKILSPPSDIDLEDWEESKTTQNPTFYSIGTMQNRFLNLDTFFICLAYDDLMVGISDGTNCF